MNYLKFIKPTPQGIRGFLWEFVFLPMAFAATFFALVRLTRFLPLVPDLAALDPDFLEGLLFLGGAIMILAYVLAVLITAILQGIFTLIQHSKRKQVMKHDTATE